MGWFGKLTFGTMGMLFGGPLGAIAGAALGHHLVDKREEDLGGRQQSFQYVERSQAAYFVSIFSIMGKLAKVDGVVTRDEIGVMEKFLSTLSIPEQEKQFARQVFNQAKDSAYSIDDFAMQLYQINQQQPTLLLSFMDLLFKLAAADGKLHFAEEAALNKIKDIFRISDQQFNNIKAVYFKDVDRYYKTLNSTPDSSNQEIKANYKKLVKDFHPDKIISKGLPEEFIQFATKRFQEIQESYEKIRQERNF
ncbi:TerB family tellurite resistance protein [Thermodesulfobacteriota bacterium]